MNEAQISKLEKEWAKEKKIIKRKQKIDREKKSLKGKRFSTTKFIMFFLFLNCTAIELFTGWSTVQSLRLAQIMGMSPDFTPLVTLIGTVVGEVISFSIYAIKATRENTANGITYELAMRENNMDNSDYSDSVG